MHVAPLREFATLSPERIESLGFGGLATQFGALKKYGGKTPEELEDAILTRATEIFNDRAATLYRELRLGPYVPRTFKKDDWRVLRVLYAWIYHALGFAELLASGEVVREDDELDKEMDDFANDRLARGRFVAYDEEEERWLERTNARDERALGFDPIKDLVFVSLLLTETAEAVQAPRPFLGATPFCETYYAETSPYFKRILKNRDSIASLDPHAGTSIFDAEFKKAFIKPASKYDLTADRSGSLNGGFRFFGRSCARIFFLRGWVKSIVEYELKTRRDVKTVSGRSIDVDSSARLFDGRIAVPRAVNESVRRAAGRFEEKFRPIFKELSPLAVTVVCYQLGRNEDRHKDTDFDVVSYRTCCKIAKRSEIDARPEEFLDAFAPVGPALKEAIDYGVAELERTNLLNEYIGRICQTVCGWLADADKGTNK